MSRGQCRLLQQEGTGGGSVSPQTSLLCLGLVEGSGVAPCTDRHCCKQKTDRRCLQRPLLAQVGPFLPLMLWVLLTSMPLPASEWDSPERVCERGKSSLETGGGSGKEKVVVGALRAPGRMGVCTGVWVRREGERRRSHSRCFH